MLIFTSQLTSPKLLPKQFNLVPKKFDVVPKQFNLLPPKTKFTSPLTPPPPTPPKKTQNKYSAEKILFIAEKIQLMPKKNNKCPKI